MGWRFPLAAALGVVTVATGVALGHGLLVGDTAIAGTADNPAGVGNGSGGTVTAAAGPGATAFAGTGTSTFAIPGATVGTSVAGTASRTVPATPSGTPASTPAAIVPGLAPYVGTWRVHGAEMTIEPNGTATERIQLGPCRGISVPVRCTATATLKVDLSPGAPHLLYTGFRYTDDSGATVVPDSLEGLPKVGDGYRVRAFAPGVIELIPLTEHLRQILGSPYRCNADADQSARQRLCNA
ncbi:hypothetical protein [Catellatospora methionotrophica]|uniref:hypothetical protein n=1 Tax=Catellatospora methionotrophica TaxID=121620 RepID=UPI00340EDE09